MDAPFEPMHKDYQQSNEESSTETPTDPKEQCIFKELKAKRCMNQFSNSSTRSRMEAQLNWLVKVINDATDVVTKEKKKST